MNYPRTTLDNGLEIIGEQNPDAKSVALGFFVRTGSRDETPAIAGVSHFLEHMVFKGNADWTPDKVNLEFDRIGAKYNAQTSDEATVYYGAVLPERQERLLGLFGSLMRPSLRSDDFDTEKKVILEEIALYLDNPGFTLIDKAQEWFFGEHPLGQSVLGTDQSITDLTRDQMMEYFTLRYAPNNIKLVLTGAFDWDAAVRQAETLTRDWEPQRTPRVLTEPEPRPAVRVEKTDKYNRAHLCWMTAGLAEQDPGRYAADVAAYAVGARRGSRLYWALTEPGIADSAWFDHWSKDGGGIYVGYASCDPTRSQEVADLLREALQTAKADGLTEAEVNGSRRKIAAGRTLHGETPLGRLMSVGSDWLYRHEVNSLDEEIERTLAVTVEDANDALAALKTDAALLAGLGPIEALR